ncbi:hydroxymethylpyrimidine/phosphomethylpyrimidine kinase [Corynebacterium sp. 320]|uniref:Hydroxymethylpyrimidine/phosphomethylpyrimidine kinase n=1 Tax=Corynebacterium zhongnanshanii TaxID=2768834 RepID=A0ABQ6VFG1_9CORY|nr:MULTISPECIES: bifunctional hydroxymethylpyrimidine kinase/phosphomethylpyrimidine kinase [Corynebacterium]KAB1504007.1 hydroxymethylpyrimidine/phosphomethylpyrimidine kinase [Corynebacterium sp. 320]KAB1552894.1 hydroxymethylpyrimidine/phosphomethylpyrimidine kinase [Corynebacterium sp. 321]KAB1553888.1 hydroxymethylpyrimidine/phosphomethylpyrimidine kinase [Corynebacterium sp. 319]KAB3523144.1 hydroxymethylpyrimidine/phosphomethylpyrimidine kinase [Corynebacterium zhongnanshanii]KAB3528143
MIPNILSIAGSDPSGGAGIQADLKAISAAGGYGMSVITALTAQNTCGVTAVHVPDTDFLTAQLEAISDDIQIGAIKIGMLATTEVITTVKEWFDRNPQLNQVPVVLDPVMIATSGARLLDDSAMEALQGLLPYARVITPNIPELEVISNVQDDNGIQRDQDNQGSSEHSITSLDDAVELAQRWQHQVADSGSLRHGSAPAVLVKGGHLSGSQADNVLVRPDGSTLWIPCERINTTNTHGTGCSLSSALATKLAVGDLDHAASWATTWLRGAIAASDQLQVGRGHGPVHHFYR